MWEKTIIKAQQLLDDGIAHPHCLGCAERATQAQAEITGGIAYKEGIRKVVEWLDSHNNSDVDLEVLTAEWQAFKQELKGG